MDDTAPGPHSAAPSAGRARFLRSDGCVAVSGDDGAGAAADPTPALIARASVIQRIQEGGGVLTP